MAYLDNTGLNYFWGKIKSALSSKQNKITASGILKGDGAGGIEAATPGTDYADVFIIDCTADGTDDESSPISQQ